MKYLLIIFTSLLFSSVLLAQKCAIRGTIYDKSNGELIMFANVFLVGTDLGTTSDLDGAFSLNVAPGIYNLRVSYMGYADQEISDISIEEGSVKVLDVYLKVEGELVEEVVVSAQQLRNTASALMTIQQKSANVMDGISSQSFRRTGDSDAGEAIKRVTGISIEDGKHVIVRGLGDRYNKTLFNGLGIPGLDPDRNSVEMDIFPNNIIDNIIVYKTFTPNLPGDFTGGVINVTSKDFPTEKTLNVSMGASYNPDMHINPNFLSYQKGKTDWLGYDDGSRALPFGNHQSIPDISDPNNNQLVPFLTKQLNKSMGVQKSQNDINKNFSISAGNQNSFTGLTLGYFAAFKYKNETQFFENAIFQELITTGDNLNINRSSSGQIGKSDAFWSLLAGLSLKTKNHKIGFQYLKLQNGNSSASRLDQKTFETNPATIQKDILGYEESRISNYILSGKHHFGKGNFNLSWQVMPSIIEVTEPDIRITAFEVITDAADGTVSYEIRPSVGAEVNRAWRSQQESNLNSRLDMNYTLVLPNDRETKIDVGFLNSLKERDFNIQNFLFRVKQQSALNIIGEPDILFLDENIWTPETGIGTYIRGNFEPSNTYNATQNILSAYVMNELPISNYLKLIYGIRAEKVENYYTGQSNDGQRILDNEKVLDNADFLPSLNLIFDLGSKMKIRMSGSKTVARPTFKEKSLAQIQDRISGRTFLGNLDLEQSNITNIDLRWEYFFNQGELLSISTFYKDFTKPIELVAFSTIAPNNFQPKNGEDTYLYGLEIDFRNRLDFISPYLAGFSTGFNATIIESSIKINEEEDRPLMGQSPFIINAILGYNNATHHLDLNLNYNLQAERLSVVGTGGIPHVYETPFHSLNAKISKKFGPEKQFNVGVSAKNLLKQSKTWVYKHETMNDEIFQLFDLGRSFSVTLAYTY